MRILGVDPGSRLTGYGCVDKIGPQLRHVAHGTMHIANTHGKATVPLEDRLLSIYEGLSQIIQDLRPQVMVIEKVFFAKNALSALKLGQARGAAMLTGKIHSLAIAEYSATEVKRAIVGHGQADKSQVARMLQILIGKQTFVTDDASDGLALAICHAFAPIHSATLKSGFIQRSKKRLSLAESLGISSRKKDA